MLSVTVARSRVHLRTRVEPTSALVVPASLAFFPVVVVPFVGVTLVVVRLTEIAILVLVLIVVVAATIALALATLDRKSVV